MAHAAPRPPTSTCILVVDDEEANRALLEAHLGDFVVLMAEGGRQALDVLTKNPVDLVLLDVMMEGMSGIETLDHVRRDHPEIPVIMITASSAVPLAVECMKKGAFDYFSKPVNREKLIISVRHALEMSAARRKIARLSHLLEESFGLAQLVGDSQAMKEVYRLILKVADSDLPVLVTGESGTGKELVARALHGASGRKGGPFEALNSAAMPKDLAESELFGHEAGAFTGAAGRRRGKIELASGGTLFLDEIGDMNIEIQAKLLRVLEDNTYQRIGGTETLRADIRLVSATHRDLWEKVSRGEFRQDLFYRVNAVIVRLPALHERREDIPLLAAHFLERFRDRRPTRVRELTPAALDALLHRDWPGNVRELKNVVERAALLADGTAIRPEDLLAPAAETAAPAARLDAGGLEEQVAELERSLIQQALRRSGGVRSRAADLLKISERVIRYKINKYALDEAAEAEGGDGGG
jgi:DNA-binding NtrC family response regulator